jgi:hypothetical protein
VVRGESEVRNPKSEIRNPKSEIRTIAKRGGERRDGEMERWRDGEMERWRDGEML